MSLEPQNSSRSETENVVTQAQFASLRGVSEAMVSRWKAKHRLVFNADGRVLVAESIALLARTQDPARGGRRSPVDTASNTAAARDAAYARGAAPAAPSYDAQDKSNYNVEAARERRAKAQLAELELAEKAGQLVKADEVRALYFDRVRAARDVFAQIARRLAPTLALESDVARIEQLLNGEYRAVCAALAGNAAADEGASA